MSALDDAVTDDRAPHLHPGEAVDEREPGPPDVDPLARTDDAGPGDRTAVDASTWGLRWWREILYILTFYAVYTFIRNQFGSAAVDSTVAYDHAREIIALERSLGLFHEQTIQSWFLDWPWFLRFWNVFYGTFHFVVTIGALAWLFVRHARDYRVWRNTLAFTTGLALIGFSIYPLMPPRLLCDCEWGAGQDNPAFVDTYDFVDTLAVHGGLWSFDEGAMEDLSNQYAAMPSLHFAWAAWSALVLYPRVRHRWARWLAALYPWATLFAIVVTANHFWLDAVGGAVVLGMGFAFGSALARVTERRRRAALVAA